jgi:hypothetical protein
MEKKVDLNFERADHRTVSSCYIVCFLSLFVLNLSVQNVFLVLTRLWFSTCCFEKLKLY